MWLRYVRVFAVCLYVHLSVVCLSATFVHPTQPVKIYRNIYTPFCTLAIYWPPGKILRRCLRGTPLSGVKRKGVAKYSAVGHVEGYISETVRDTASGTIMTNRNYIRKIQWYHCGSSGVTPNKGYGPKFGETAYISADNRARKVKSDAQVDTNKNSDHVQKLFT